MTFTIAPLTKSLRFERAALGARAKASRGAIGVVLCALTLLATAPSNAHAQGSLVSWGNDYHGAGLVPGTPTTGSYTAVAAGGFHALAIRTDGTLVSWGANPGNVVTDTPAGTFTAIAAGSIHSVAIRTDGTLVSWGGRGPLYVPVAGTFTAIAASRGDERGTDHNIAIRTDGTLVSWGNDDEFGQVSDTPAGTYTAVAAGNWHSVAIDTQGHLVSWGDDFAGAVSDTPTSGTYIAVAAGYGYSVATRSDRTLVYWGRFGPFVGTPTGTFTTASAGDSYSVAIRANGTLVAWGDDIFGTVSAIPAGSYSAIAAGYEYSVAIARPTTEQLIEFLSQNVQKIVNGGAPLPARGKSLQALLQVADAALAKDHPGVALVSIDAFIIEVDNFVRQHRLTPSQGQSLVNTAWMIITDLGG